MDRRNNWVIEPNFERLKEARLARGFSMTDLARELNLSRQAISKYENNQMSPSPDILKSISNILQFPERYFFKSFYDQSIADSIVYFRSLKSTESMFKSMYYIRLLWAVRLIKSLEEYVKFPKYNFPIPIELSINADIDTIEEYACQLREYWGLGYNPITNLTTLVESNGIFVSYINYGQTKIDACSYISNNGDRAYIMLSSDKLNAYRTRFDISHELGHLLLHQYFSKEEFELDSNFKAIEKQAHDFAGAFLMPRKVFANEVYSTSLGHLFELKKRWKVSIAAIIHRCAALDLFTEHQLTNLWIELGKKKWRKKEPLDDIKITPIEKPVLIKKACDLLYQKDIISPMDIKENLALSNDDFQELTRIELKEYEKAEIEKGIHLHLIKNKKEEDL